VDLPDGTAIDYVVDAFGRRVAKQVNGVPTKGWIYKDSLKIVAETDGAGALVSQFTYANGAPASHSPEFMLKAGQTYRFVKDQVGSVRLVVNVLTGQVVQELTYDAFGRVLTDSSPGFQPFGFAGGLYDANTGLVRFGARDYDAETGRWTRKDPRRFNSGDGPNLFAYANNDPVNFHDPNGKSATAAALPIAGGAAVLDGPLPIGDVIGAGLLVCALIYDALTDDDGPVEIRGEGKELARWADETGLGRDGLRKAIEKIKHAAKLRPNENVDVLPDGTVLDRVGGEEIGNVHDEEGD